MSTVFPMVGQGTGRPVNENERKKDVQGFTHPNLHRRIDPQQLEEGSGEVNPRDYKLGIYNVNSYRTTIINTHDEESTTSEIP